jgi:hypothetical protein
MIVNATGLPLASPGTVNGLVPGVVIVIAANATPAIRTTTAALVPRSTNDRRNPVRMKSNLSVETLGPKIAGRRPDPPHTAGLFAAHLPAVHQTDG